MTSLYEICTFCKKKFLSKNILKHEDNCDYQLKIIIGPDLEWVRCNLCLDEMYKLPIPTYAYHRKELYVSNNEGIESHHKRRHKCEEISYITVDKKGQRQEAITEDKISDDESKLLFRKYRITTSGNVYNSLGKLVKKSGKTYESIKLHIDGRNNTYIIDHLVATTFLEKPEAGIYMIHHKDEDIFNNHKDNLEYVKWNEHDAHNTIDLWSRCGDFHRKKYTFSKTIEIN